jgi:hypothetical protein
MIGRSFAPTNDRTAERRGPSPAPIQEAIRVLSLQMPRVAGASAPTAQSMMAGAPGAGGGGLGGPTSNPIIEQLLRALFGGQGQMGGGQMPGLPGAPPAPPQNPFPGFGFVQPPVRPTPPPMGPPPAMTSSMGEQPSKAPASPMFNPLGGF